MQTRADLYEFMRQKGSFMVTNSP